MYEPYSLPILNSNFTSPTVSGSPYWTTLTTSTIGWTPIQAQIGYSTLSPWNAVSLSSIVPSCSQFCALQRDGASLSQDITCNKSLTYTLSWWIIARNPTLYTSTTYIQVFINETKIFEYNNLFAGSWIKYSANFKSDGLTTLKFQNSNVSTTLDSSFLITGVRVFVA